MKTRKIVADSSANLLQLNSGDFAFAPLRIVTDSREFVDDAQLDVGQMTEWFASYKIKSHTACPGTGDWLSAFGDAEEIFCVTITSGLSGSYNAACTARELYLEKHPDRQVLVIDSLSAGPEMVLLIEKLEELLREEREFDEISREILTYRQKTGLVFMLESLKNFAANGRVSPAVAKLAGFLGIRIVGKASLQGTLEPVHKCRGQQRSLEAIAEHLQANGLWQGKVWIHHCQNAPAAELLADMIRQRFPAAKPEIGICRGLCSYYAEKGGLLVGYEKF